MSLVFAHGVGGRVDLPISVTLAQWAAVGVLALTFVLLGRRWRNPKFVGDGGRPMPGVQRIIDSSWSSVVLRGAGLLALVLTFTYLVFGPDNSAENPAPTWIFVWLWVGLVPLSLLCGPVWRRIDPLPVLSSGVRAVMRRGPGKVAAYPDRLGRWPAALGLLAFTWLELVGPERDDPRRLAIYLAAYIVVHVVAGVVFGSMWHERGGAFTAYSDFIARMGPWMRDSQGRLRAVNPLRTISGTKPEFGAPAVVFVLLGSTAFDGFGRTQRWAGWVNDASTTTAVILGTVGLLVAIGIVALTFAVAVGSSAALIDPHGDNRSVSVLQQFAPSLVPIVVGYTVAHYFSLFVFQGQAGYLLAGDPFGNGSDVFGLADRAIDYDLLSTTAIAWVQVGAIVVGHVVGVLVAHDRATSVYQRSELTRAQIPLIMVMVAYTVGGIGLLLGV